MSWRYYNKLANFIIKISTKRHLAFISLILIIFQIADGILTTIGVNTFGIGVEGNHILQSYMHMYPAPLVLFFIKTLSILVISVVWRLAIKENCISLVLPLFYLVLSVYLWGAIIPWLILLFL